MTITRQVRDIIETCTNARTRIEIVGDELRITCEGHHANVIDARSMMSCLDQLKSIGFISDNVMTIWAGIRNGKFTMFCRM
jgi:enolase